MGKTQGMKKAQREIKNLQDYEGLKQAITRFAAYLRSKGTEPEFIPYFSTFMSSWRDWLETETGQVKLAQQAPIPPSQPPVEEEDAWSQADPKRVREILDRAMHGKSSYSYERFEAQEGLVGDLEEAGSDDSD